MRLSGQKSKALFAERTANGAWFIALLLAAGIAPIFGDTVTGTTGSNAPLENRQPALAIRYIIALQGIAPGDDQGDPVGSSPPDRSTPFLGEIRAVPFNFAPNGWAFCEGQLLSIAQNQLLYNLLGTAYGGDGNTTFALPDLRERVFLGAGQGSGLPNYSLGNIAGIKNPVLSVANLPSHTHTFSGGNTAPVGSGAPLDNRQPSLALYFLIAADGEIMIVPWAREPFGWCHCDGRVLSSATHTYLFNNIGTRYGGSAANFAVPDLRGRVIIGDDGGGTFPLGLAYGSENIVLTVSAIAAHTHTLTGGATGSTGGPGATANNYQPSLVMQWILSFFGNFPSPSGVISPFVGEMRLLAGLPPAGLTQDDGWAPLYGQLEDISENETLFNLIGTTYGGDGQNTFGLPDLRARVSAGVNGGTFVIGETVGTATLGVSVAQLAAHAHSLLPLQLQITAIQHFSDSSVQLTLAGTIGNTCQVDLSDDLSGWSNLGSIQFTSSTATITDPNPTHVPKRFYKANYP